MSAPETRRGFIRGLTALPLIGGGAAFAGQSSGPASVVSDQERAFLALAPVLAPMLAENDRLWQPIGELWEAACEKYPDCKVREKSSEWQEYRRQYDIANDLTSRIYGMLEPFDQLSMQTPAAIVLRLACGTCVEHLQDEAFEDAKRLYGVGGQCA